MIRLLRWIPSFALLCLVALPVHAAYFQFDFPLSGHNAYRLATGKVTFSESIGQPKRDDGTTLVIEISNVPLPAGTELIVYVHEEEVGTIKLNKQRGGRLVLESTSKKAAPRIKPGSFVTLKLDDGTTVMW